MTSITDGSKMAEKRVFIIALFLFVLGYVRGGGMFRDCGGTLTAPHGIIQSPNFPGPFPMPINCRWIIHAPEQSNIIILYITQFFLYHSFYVTEYDDLRHANTKRVLEPINATVNLKSVVFYTPYVVLELVATDSANLNLRVEDFLLDVHGFNVTYEIVPRGQETKDSCSVHGCNALGHCLATNDYSSFYCSCFNGFYGKNCEFGKFCDPDKGKNPCLNGGVCRYFFGSKFLQCLCPEGYGGKRCEIKKEPVNNECPKDHNCNHRCIQKDSQCVCKPGYRLEADGVTCKELERYRVIVKMPVVQQDNLEERLETALKEADSNFFKCQTILYLAELDGERFEMDSVSNETIVFHFYIKKTSASKLDHAFFSYIIGGGRYFGVNIDVKKTTILKEPELKIVRVENADKGPALEGNLLTLSCVARGSDDLRFRWFMDDRPYDMSLTHRNAWEIRLPETISEVQISQLNIDGVTVYDKGRFTCEVSDFGQSLNNSVDLDVLPYPQVEVTPLTISASPGQIHSYRCLSPDDSKSSFTYSWLKNNKPIKLIDSERIEDLQPSGSRLLVNGAKENTNYTCQVTNKAGMSTRTVYLFVGQGIDSCSFNAKDGIRWQKTLGGYFNLQKCPTDQNDHTDEDKEFEKTPTDALSRLSGFTQRRCECTKSTCKWMQPNYSGCHSIHLTKLYNRVMKIQQGYPVYQLENIYKELYGIAQEAHSRMFAGDLDITATILYMILTTARDFPSLVHSSFELHEIVDFLNIVLVKTTNMTDDEIEDLQTGARVVQIVELLTELHRHRLINLTSARAPKIAMDVFSVQLQPQRIDPKVSASPVSTRVVKRDVEQVHIEKSIKVLSAHYDHSILEVLDMKNRDELKEEMFLSDVISIVPLAPRHEKTSHYLVEIPHKSGIQGHTHKKSTNLCYSWQRQEREYTEGEWRSEPCHTIETFENMTRCACLIPGHFTVVIVPVNQTVLHSKPGDSFTVLIVACVLSICCLSFGLAVYLIFWRYLRHVKHSIHLNFLVSLLGLNATCLMCILKPDDEAMCIAGKILLQFFLVAAFTFLFLDGVQLFAGIHINLHSLVAKGCCKFTIIGWGIAGLAVVCVVSMMEVIGYDKQCDHWCFWNQYSHHFYSILIPIIILIMCHTVISLLCIFIIVKWNSDYHYRKRWKMLLEYGRSETLLILLLVVFCVSTFNVRDKGLSAQIIFLIFDLLLVILSVLMFCVLKKPIRVSLQLLYRCSWHELSKEEFPAVRNYVPPELQEERSRAAAEQIHEYCDRVDQERYTSKHRRQLRFLLNSSSSSSSSGACCSGPSENGNSNDSWAPRARTSANNADSGISEGTESEKSLSQVREEGRGSSQPTDGAGVASHKQNHTGKKTQNRSGKKSKTKHKPSTSNSKEGSSSQESQTFSKSSTQISELHDIDIEVEGTAENKRVVDNSDVSSYLLGLKYSGNVKSPSEVNCLLQEEELSASKL